MACVLFCQPLAVLFKEMPFTQKPVLHELLSQSPEPQLTPRFLRTAVVLMAMGSLGRKDNHQLAGIGEETGC